ncbi:50S ribosomal protein L3 [Immundisolibacter sp.]|uniref:50S ribosomal protein L3 n=1 Tax=Immundisolibacter sp. TaxID=1934948 RepID=UPI00260CA107|nr:50S ribosomal protein L3 [Immundisolibacter sp.]MDD3652222.1 50S ribosomal protein L3 [Immundisolibacter sp.]
MAIGLVGRKCGMTRIFTADGAGVPVTVIDVSGNRVVQVRTPEVDGYRAIQVTRGSKRAALVGKALAGHYAKAGVEPGQSLTEFRLADDGEPAVAVGQALGADQFEAGQKVNVTGVTRGRGFSGTVRRWGFGGGDATHGNSLSHRAPGSIGQNQTPGRVFPGKKMAGHYGNEQRTQRNLEVVKVDAERGLLLVKGAVPGPQGGELIVRPATGKKAGA